MIIWQTIIRYFYLTGQALQLFDQPERPILAAPVSERGATPIAGH